MVEIIKVIGTILAAMITTFGGGYLMMKKFYIERQDAKDKELLQKQIDETVEKSMNEFIAKCGEIGDKQIDLAKQELHDELVKGLEMRGKEGKERFDINSKAINENTSMIKEILVVQKDQTEKFDKMADAITALANVSEACAEAQRNSTYDRLLMVTSKIINAHKMTLAEKTNLVQLYDSYKKLNGTSKELDIRYEECLKITPTLEDA